MSLAKVQLVRKNGVRPGIKVCESDAGLMRAAISAVVMAN
jgi:hypothetical protein